MCFLKDERKWRVEKDGTINRIISSFCIMSQAERPVLPHNRHPCCRCPPPRVSSLCLQVRLNLKDVLFWPRLINASKPLPFSSSSQICFSRRCSTARMWRWVSSKHLRGFYFQVWEKFRLFFLNVCFKKRLKLSKFNCMFHPDWKLFIQCESKNCVFKTF